MAGSPPDGWVSFPSLTAAPGLTDPCAGWLELAEPGYEPFDSGQLAPLHTVTVPYGHGPYPPPPPDTVYSLEGPLPAPSHCSVLPEEYGAQVSASLGWREPTWVLPGSGWGEQG